MQTSDKLKEIQWVLERYRVERIEDIIELRESLIDALKDMYDHCEDLSTEEAEVLEKELCLI